MLNPIIYAVPLFFTLLLVELAASWRMRRPTYNLSDSLTSVSLGLSTQVFNVFTKFISVGVYLLAYEHLALFQLPANQWWVWLIGIIGYDFFYYWNHRMGHEVNVLWASHVVHHSSEEYNYATALRQSSTGFLFSWLFFWPLAVIGVPPSVFVISAALSLFYQFWIHTRLIGRLGWFDRCFASPSNHRVHHGQNAYCVDKNYGAIFMLWDHLFGTFAAERDEKDEPIIYGIHGQLNTLDPLWANLHKYHALYSDARLAGSWKERLLVWVKKPGWRPARAEALQPWPEHDLGKFRIYRPQISPRAALYCGLQALLLFVVGSLFVGFAMQVPVTERVVLSAWLLGSLWAMGASLDGRATSWRWQWAWLASLPVPAVIAVQLWAVPLQWLVSGLALYAVAMASLLLQAQTPTNATARVEG